MNPEINKLNREVEDISIVMGSLATVQSKVNMPRLKNIENHLNERPEVQKVSLEGISVITLKGDQGEKGDEPSDERLEDLILPLIPEPIKGDDGQDYILTEKDKKDIAKSIKVPVVEKVIEKIEVIIKEPIVTNEIKEVAISETAEEIANKLESLKDEARLDVKAIKGIDKILEVFRGSLIPMVSSGVKTLQGLFDTNIINPTNNQALVYNITTQKWENKNVSGGSSITLQTNGVNNTVQNLLNLKAGANITLAADASGGVTINSTASGSGTVTNVSSATADATIATPTTTPVITIVSAPKLTTPRTINGVAFDGTANITVVDVTKEPIIAAGTTSQYYRGDKTFQTLDKTAVGLANVDNTSDVSKPVSTPTQAALNLKEDLSNKATSTALGTSNTLYPSQNAVKVYVDTQSALKENLITGTTSADFLSGAKTFTNFATTVRSTVLTGLSLLSTTVISATDTVLVALGSLQAQITSLTTGKQNTVALTTTGTSGPSTFNPTTGALNIPNYASSNASTLTWDFLVDNWSVKPTKVFIPTGKVFTYTLLGTTRYRFVPTIYNPTQDAFYSNFDGTTLTNLITTRG